MGNCCGKKAEEKKVVPEINVETPKKQAKIIFILGGPGSGY
jgi:hypothetical protein